MQLTKQDSPLVVLIIVLLSLHLAYVVLNSMPGNTVQRSDNSSTLLALHNQTTELNDDITNKFSRLYGIEPQTPIEQAAAEEPEDTILSAMQPRLLAVDIENNLVKVHVLLSQNTQVSRHTLTLGEELFGYTLVEANLRAVRFENASDQLTLNMFKSFVPTSASDN